MFLKNMRPKFDLFVIALLISIAVAYFYPDMVLWGDGELLNQITSIGVALIFFLYGLKLSFHEIKSGLKNWKLHLMIQSFTFIVFPLVVLAFYPFVKSPLQFDFWLSFFFLAALPSTVSSSVVLVSLAKGNIPASIFNASISGLIGVLVTPLWMALFLSFDGDTSFGSIYAGLVFEIILPVILGLLLQKYWGRWAKKNSKALSNFDKFVILLIVYASFAESFVSGVFEQTGKSYLAYVVIGSLILFYIIYWILSYLSRKVLRFEEPDAIAGIFCGTKKSLTHGSVFGKLLFVNNPSAGLYYLPLIIYHALQILILTLIAQRYGHREVSSGEKEYVPIKK